MKTNKKQKKRKIISSSQVDPKNQPTTKSAQTQAENKTNHVDWITALSKQVVSNDLQIIRSRKDTKDPTAVVVLSKKERIERRNAKKRRREERIGLSFQNTTGTSFTSKQNAYTDSREKATSINKAEYSMVHLKRLQEELHQIISRFEEVEEDDDDNDDGDDGNLNHQKSNPKQKKSSSLYVSQEVKGKATSGQKLTDDNIQPRNSDYGGLGFARKSLLISLRDVSFVPKLEQEFAEHVHGFFGKQRTKAMKKQLDGNMLWRRLQQEKNSAAITSSSAKKKKDDLNQIQWNGKKLSTMTPDERVEAMIKLNLI